MGHLRRTLRATTARPRPMADGARDRTPHRTPQAVATTVVAAVAATTVAAVAVVTAAAVVDTDSQQ